MKKMKKITGVILITLMSIFILNCSVSAKDIVTTKSRIKENIYTNEHTYWGNWTDVSYAKLFAMKNNKYIRVEDSYKHFIVECFNSSYKSLWAKKIKKTLPMWGSVGYDGKDFFVVTGQENQKENDKKTVICITRYNSKWKKTGEAKVNNCYTIVPFDAGSCSVVFYGDTMYIKTSRTMYKTDDGLNHQSSMTIVLDKKKMKILDHPTDLCDYTYDEKNYGYVSHSFNQIIRVDDGNLIAVDHGDAYPRSMVLNDINDIDGIFENSYEFFQIAGDTGDNCTGATLGDFQISDNNYIICGTSVDQKKAAKHNKILSSGVKNVYIATMNKKSHKTKFRFVTKYKSNDNEDYTPYLTKISKNRYMLIWYHNNKLYYREVNGDGKFITKLKYKKNYKLSDCEPIAVNGKIKWFATNKNKISFYSLNYNIKKVTLSKPELINSQNYKDCNKIKWKSVKGADGYYIYRSKNGGKFEKIGEYNKKLEKDKFFQYKFSDFKEYETYVYGVSAYYIVDSTGKRKEGNYSKASKKYIYLKKIKVNSIENTESGLKISWTSRNKATGYVIYKKNISDTSKSIEKCTTISSGQIDSYEDNDVKDGIVYAYSIVEIYDDYEGQYRDEYAKYMRINTPVIDKYEFINGKFYVDVSGDDITKYLNIYRKEEDGKWEKQEIKSYLQNKGEKYYLCASNKTEYGHKYSYKLVNERIDYDNPTCDKYFSLARELEVICKAPAKNVQINSNRKEEKETITWDFAEDAKSYKIYVFTKSFDYFICELGEVDADTNVFENYYGNGGKRILSRGIVVQPQ